MDGQEREGWRQWVGEGGMEAVGGGGRDRGSGWGRERRRQWVGEGGTEAVGGVDQLCALLCTVPPSPPTITSAMATSSTSITVQWTASTDDGGSPLISYVVQYRLSGEEAAPFNEVTFGNDVFTMTITGLTPYGLYEVRVLGENLVGRGDSSASLLERDTPSW